MNKIELIKTLREATKAGMNDCKIALEEAGWDFEEASNLIKARGLACADSRSGNVAAEGIVACAACTNGFSLVEVNCQTDFAAKSDSFVNFAIVTAATLADCVDNNVSFTELTVESKRLDLVSSIKENVVVRRWFVEQSMSPNAKTFSYVHPNSKIGVLLTLVSTSPDVLNTPEFNELGSDLTLQIAAMNPLAVDRDSLHPVDVDNQKHIFSTQLEEAKKPESTWSKILDGKFNKWYTEVCLVDQESIVVPKTSVKQVIATVAQKLNTVITVSSFTRVQVGEGLASKKEDFGQEVAKLVGDSK